MSMADEEEKGGMTVRGEERGPYMDEPMSAVDSTDAVR